MTRPEYQGVDLDVPYEVPKRVSPTIELGSSGLKRTGGYLDEEFLPQLRGRKAVQIYREMADNDPIIGALLFALDRLLRQIDWRVEPASDSAEDKKAAEFVEECMKDMSHSWDDLISEILTMLPYGWSYHEIVYKRRVGPWETDPTKKSKFNDGKIGWRKIPIRSQETLQRWVFDESGGIQAMIQLSPPYYKTVVLPIEKCLLFRSNSVKNSPEGRSVLRNAYRPWYMKKRIEEIEAIGAERDLAGMPVGKVPASYLNAKPGTDQAKMVEAFRKMVRSVRRDEQEGILIPSEFDQDTKQPLFDFQLLASGGSRQFDTSGIIQRYEQRMLMTVLADFILVGHEGEGSYALHTDKSGLFRTAINSFAQSIADVFNRHAIPRLFLANGWKPDELPTLVPSDIDPPDLTQLGAFLQQTTSAGMNWFPDAEMEKFIRKAARVPELDEDAEKQLELESQQADILRVAQQQMELLALQQQAQQGVMSMQMMDQGINPEMMQQQQQMQQKDEQHQTKLQAMQQQQKFAEDKHKMGLRQSRDQFNQNQTAQRMQTRQNMSQAKQTHAQKLAALKAAKKKK